MKYLATSLIAALLMKVGSGQWIVGSVDLFTAYCPLPTAHCPLFSEELDVSRRDALKQ